METVSDCRTHSQLKEMSKKWMRRTVNVQAEVSMWGDWGTSLYCRKGVRASFFIWQWRSQLKQAEGRRCTLTWPGRTPGWPTWPSPPSGFPDGALRSPGSVHNVWTASNKSGDYNFFLKKEFLFVRLGWKPRAALSWTLALGVARLQRWFLFFFLQLKMFRGTVFTQNQNLKHSGSPE